jgi:K+-transporting ATPase ATPase A chain
MTTAGLLQIGFFLGVLLALAKPLGEYMAAVYEGRRTILSPVLEPLSRQLHRWAGVEADSPMTWRQYALALLCFNAAGLAAVYLIQRSQGILPLNPAGMGGVEPDSAFNVAASFASNTNWQNYGGETTLSHFTQMLALTTQNFVSAATGMAVMAALARGVGRRESNDLGNFWTDLTRGTLHILLPLSIVLALALAWQGVPQTLAGSAQATLLESGETRTIALGPVASQVAIKQLGTNGGGFFNANSAHPLENPTPLANFLQLLAILLIPVALCVTFGRMVGDPRQGWTLMGAMAVLFLAALGVALWAEQGGNPALDGAGVSRLAVEASQGGPLGAAPGGNMEGKEVRNGVASSALWAVATTAASNGSVNSMHDSYMPLSGLVLLLLIQTGEVVFGGVGSGVYGMVVFAILAVFAAGLMVGRTPEYAGKKIGPFEMKMASVAILIPAALILLATAAGVSTAQGLDGRSNPGAHGFSQILYAFSSMSGNNGSAFAGYGADAPLPNLLGGACMWIGRYWIMVAVLAIAGSLGRKKAAPPSPGTLPTHGPLFVALLAAIVLAAGALTFLPALALGPVAEHFQSAAPSSPAALTPESEARQ